MMHKPDTASDGKAKLCKDCRWSEASDLGDRFMECHAPQNMTAAHVKEITDKINGKTIYEAEEAEQRYNFCSTHRESHYGLVDAIFFITRDTCEDIGRWWEPRG